MLNHWARILQLILLTKKQADFFQTQTSRYTDFTISDDLKSIWLVLIVHDNIIYLIKYKRSCDW